MDRPAKKQGDMQSMGSVDSQASPDPTSSSTTFYAHCTWEEQNVGNELHSRVAALSQKHLTRTEAFAQLIRQIDGSMTDINEDHLQGKCPRDHQLVQLTSSGMICDKCNKKWPKGTISHRCCKCDYDECPACAGLTGADSEEEEKTVC